MALQTQPNVTLNSMWKVVADNATQVIVQLVDGPSAVIYIGASAPAAGFTGGHVLSMTGDRSLPISGLTTEKVYGLALYVDSGAILAVTKG